MIWLTTFYLCWLEITYDTPVHFPRSLTQCRFQDQHSCRLLQLWFMIYMYKLLSVPPERSHLLTSVQQHGISSVTVSVWKTPFLWLFDTYCSATLSVYWFHLTCTIFLINNPQIYWVYGFYGIHFYYMIHGVWHV